MMHWPITDFPICLTPSTISFYIVPEVWHHQTIQLACGPLPVTNKLDRVHCPVVPDSTGNQSFSIINEYSSIHFML